MFREREEIGSFPAAARFGNYPIFERMVAGRAYRFGKRPIRRPGCYSSNILDKIGKEIVYQ